MAFHWSFLENAIHSDYNKVILEHLSEIFQSLDTH